MTTTVPNKSTISYMKKESEYDQEIPHSHCRPTDGTVRKSNRKITITRHQEDKQS